VSGMPAALVLVAALLSSAFLTWKGLVPSHAFFMVLGAAVAWAAPKLGQIFARPARAAAVDSFSPEEASTNPEGRTIEKKAKKP